MPSSRARRAQRIKAGTQGRDALLALPDAALLDLSTWANTCGLTAATEFRAILGYTTVSIPGRTRRSQPRLRYDPPEPATLRQRLQEADAERPYNIVISPIFASLRPYVPSLRERSDWHRSHNLVGETFCGIVDPANLSAELTSARAALDEKVRRAAEQEKGERESRAQARAEARAIADERRARWAAGETCDILGHAITPAATGGYSCRTCAWSGRSLPSFSCPQVRLYAYGTAPGHLLTETQLAPLRLRPVGRPAGAIRKLGGDFYWLYDKTASKAIPRKRHRRCSRCSALIPLDAADQETCAACRQAIADGLKQCGRCGVFIPREAAQHDYCATCLPQIAAEQEARAQREAAQATRQAQYAALTEAAPDATRTLLTTLGDLWLLNQGVRSRVAGERARWYMLKDAVLQAIWQRTMDNEAPVLAPNDPAARARLFGLDTWDIPGEHAIDLGQGHAHYRLGLTVAHVRAAGRWDSLRSYLALDFFYGAIRYPFHAPWDNARSWFPSDLWRQCTPTRWLDDTLPHTFGGRRLTAHEMARVDWDGLIERLISFTGRPRSEVFYDPLASYYSALRAERAWGRGSDDWQDDWEDW